MGKSLVIVESPSKATIINRFLGDGFVVKASVGHIRDLPVSGGAKAKARAEGAARRTRTKKSANEALFARMGIDPTNHWKADYEIMPGKEKVVAELKKLSKSADKVYLATDLDREGEAIAWHLKEVLGGDDDRYLRVKYPEITKRAIDAAFAHPGRINMDLVKAQQTRRFLDRVVGFMVSPLLWKKVARGLSAGRVQSVAVELIVIREREIRRFIPEEYWTVSALARTKGGEELNLELASIGGRKAELHNGEDAAKAVAALKASPFAVTSVDSAAKKAHAPAPFTTSTLQQVANQRLGFSVKKTMTLAQRLYEQGYITYMRTDSVNLSQEAIAAARDIIKDKFGDDYLPPKPNYYHSKESAQEAHEAIRPSHPDRSVSGLERDEQRLYQLIFDRYLCCQMSECRYESTTIGVTAGDCGLKATGRVIVFPGFRRVWNSGRQDDVVLPQVKQGDALGFVKADPLQHFTQPPARYSEATLVKQLESDGIGRPSTYATIITTIQDRGYVRLEHGRFYAEPMGEIVTDRLMYSFKNLMDPGFTSSLEEQLDKIAAGKADWEQSLDEFYGAFEKSLEKARLPAADGGMPENRPIETELVCPKCGKHHMAVQSGKTGVFLSCLGFYDKSVPEEQRCRNTMNLKPVDYGKKKLTEEEEAEILRTIPRCPKCGAAMQPYSVDARHRLYLCGTPNCGGHLLEEGNFEDDIEKGPQNVICERCGSPMELKEGRFGKYMACTNKECGNTRKILKNGEVAPPREQPVDLPELPCKTKGSHFVLRDGAAGIFLTAHNFPKVRETRAPLVAELKRFRDRISPKFHYLADGPAEDSDGNQIEVRFSRKAKAQYLASVNKEGKLTGRVWIYDPQTSTWNEREKKSSSSASATGRRTYRRRRTASAK
jgi:DNA topoisomerase-1